jgi:hypothetical protein
MWLVWLVPKAAGLLGKITPLARQIGKLCLNSEVAYLRGQALAFLCFPKVLLRDTHGSTTKSRAPAGRGMRAAATTTDRRGAGLYPPPLGRATLTGARRSCMRAGTSSRLGRCRPPTPSRLGPGET